MIQTIEETRNEIKTTEVSIENAKRVLLNDNNSGTITESLREFSRETTNGDIHSESHKETFNESAIGAGRERSANKRSSSFKSIASSSSFGEFLCGAKGPTRDQSGSEFSIPYNIINNYFSVGVVSRLREVEKNTQIITDLSYRMQRFVLNFTWNARKIHTNLTVA